MSVAKLAGLLIDSVDSHTVSQSIKLSERGRVGRRETILGFSWRAEDPAPEIIASLEVAFRDETLITNKDDGKQYRIAEYNIRADANRSCTASFVLEDA